MPTKPLLDSPLSGKLVALPESRQLDVLSALFERRQAKVLRIPLISILDSPDQAAINSWIGRFVKYPPSYFVILTGEGLRRLCAAAQRACLYDEFIQALGNVTKICRGPKPGRALQEINLKADLLGETPTTDGIIATCKALDLNNARVAVQLYGSDPNNKLMDFLNQSGTDHVDCVAPYRYAPRSDATQVTKLINTMYAGKVDLLAFTSKSQVQRLFSIANETNLLSKLRDGFRNTHVAAIGPVVERELIDHDIEVSITPNAKFFMKPLVKAAESLFV